MKPRTGTVIVVALALAGLWTERGQAATDVSELQNLYEGAADRCRSSASEAEMKAACKEQENYAAQLKRSGLCHGAAGQAETDASWQKCKADAKLAHACVVADPTATPLNYRTRPSGSILGRLANDQKVFVQDQSTDASGKAWVYVSDDQMRQLGWVFKDYVVCR